MKYDIHTKTHLICYEDGDTRSYEMIAKDYEIINIPTDSDVDKLLRNKSTLSDVQASKVVADWHR